MIRNIATIFALIALVAPSIAGAADAVAGKASYEANCASCHGPEGAGDGPVGAILDPKPRDFGVGDFLYDTDGDGTKGSDADITNIITNGAAAYGGNAMMAPLPHLEGEEVANIIAFVRSLKK